MKKTYKLIGIALLALIIVAIFKERPKEDLRATADLNDEFSKINFETEITPKVEDKVINFSSCENEDSFTVETNSGNNSLDILGVEGNFCNVETTYDSAAGTYTNECQIPLDTGEIVFDSINFENISQYCSVKTQETN